MTLYLARLRTAYQFVKDDWQGRDGYRQPRSLPSRAFTDRADAERFVAKEVPVSINPFRREQWGFSKERGFYFAPFESVLQEGEEDAEEYNELPIPKVRRVFKRAEIPFPDTIFDTPHNPAAEDYWRTWWDDNAGVFTDHQKRVLWQLFDPVPWRILAVPLAD